MLILLVFSASSMSVPAQTAADLTAPAYVIPGGETVGIKLYTEGVLVVALADGPSPARSAGIKKGDIILSANGEKLSDTQRFSQIISDGKPISTVCRRASKTYTASLTPENRSGEYRIGVWVRDSTAGLGTVTFYTDTRFAALGHAVTDTDTGEIMSLSDGSITNAEVVGASPGKRGHPGELIGTFGQNTLGKITLNSENGLYGECAQIPEKAIMPLARRSEVCEGEAYIIADIDGAGPKQYCVNIEKISYYAKTKSIIFHVTDKALLAATGGIVQGMSGAPIIQNNKLAGAVTHVFVNDPERGYGIFSENMYCNVAG